MPGTFQMTITFQFFANTIIRSAQMNTNLITDIRDKYNAHDAASSGVHGVVGTLVGTTDTQTLSAKTLVLVKIAGSGAGTATVQYFNSATNRTHTIPVGNGDDTFVLENATQTLTNKTFTAPTLNNAILNNPTINGTVAGGASYTGITATNPTITGTVAGGATYSSITLTTPTIAAAGWANANHAHDAANTGGQLNASNIFNAGVVAVAFGGSGAATFTAHGVLLGNGGSTFGVTAAGATGTVLHGNTGADPTYSAVSLTSDVSGILPVANGGTGTNSVPAGGIVFSTGAAFSTDGTNFFWDSTNHRLGIGTNAPTDQLHIKANVASATIQTKDLAGGTATLNLIGASSTYAITAYNAANGLKIVDSFGISKFDITSASIARNSSTTSSSAAVFSLNDTKAVAINTTSDVTIVTLAANTSLRVRAKLIIRKSGASDTVLQIIDAIFARAGGGAGATTAYTTGSAISMNNGGETPSASFVASGNDAVLRLSTATFNAANFSYDIEWQAVSN